MKNIIQKSNFKVARFIKNIKSVVNALAELVNKLTCKLVALLTKSSTSGCRYVCSVQPKGAPRPGNYNSHRWSQ